MLINTLEYWVIASDFRASGVYSWRVNKLRFSMTARLKDGGFLDVVSEESGVRVVLAIRLLALAVVLLAPFGGWAFSAGMVLLVATILLFNARCVVGADGSDQMMSIIFVTLLFCVGPQGTPFTREVAVWFIALQTSLSYSAAGLAKLMSSQWRGGEAIYRIFNTATYGLPSVSRFLAGRTRLNLLLCWTVIVVETLFPLCLVLPEPWNYAFIAWGVVFHLANAAIMGLNVFLWAFLATYPALIYINHNYF